MATSIKVPTSFNGTSTAGTSATKGTTGGASDVATSNNTYFKGNFSGAGTNTLSFRAGGYGFSIPGTATIDGFEFLIERSKGNSGTGSCADNTIQIHNGTTVVGTNKSTGTAFPGTDTNITYGGPTDKWGLTYTPTDVNTTTFRVQIIIAVSVTSGTVDAQFDFIQMTIYYTDAATGKKRSVSGGASYFGGVACF